MQRTRGEGADRACRATTTHVSTIMSTRPITDLTEDAVLGGRLRLRQPRRGHRVGHDAILLAASCPARPGDKVADLGAGVGAAGLILDTVTRGRREVKLLAYLEQRAPGEEWDRREHR